MDPGKRLIPASRRPAGPLVAGTRKEPEKGRADKMAMTNEEIIMRESLELMKKGILKPTGRILTQDLPDGSKIEIPEPEPIHTYNGWKDLGYQVKKGEKAKASFQIWKYTGEKDEEGNKVKDGGHCFQKKAFWFTMDQVEKIA